MKRFSLKKRVLIFLGILTIAVGPYISQLFSFKNGTMQEIVFSQYSDFKLSEIEAEVIENNGEFNDFKVSRRTLGAEEMKKLYEYLKQLSIHTEFPQKSQNNENWVLHMDFRNEKREIQESIIISFYDSETIAVRKSGKHNIYYKVDNLDLSEVFPGYV